MDVAGSDPTVEGFFCMNDNARSGYAHVQVQVRKCNRRK